MDPVDRAVAIEGRGLEGNVDRSRRRQVTIIEREVWEELMRRTGGAAPPSARRANLMVSGCPLHDSRRRLLTIGTVQLLVSGETKPCERMDEAVAGLREAMYPDWGGGAFAQVMTGGSIAVGDGVMWAPAPTEDA